MDDTDKQAAPPNKLMLIQGRLKAPKDLKNTFGGYSYRSCEGILEAVKPLLLEHECTLTLSDEMVCVGSRNYVKATAVFSDAEYSQPSRTVSAYACEQETKKGMDSAQITGAASSYARKYALNGLFLIDDTKDPDAANDHKDDDKPQQQPAKPAPFAPDLAQMRIELSEAAQKGSFFLKAAWLGLNEAYKPALNIYKDALKPVAAKADSEATK